ncbi:MAG: serine/threonine-protein phosphatase [Gammaproteobacteria bacterium]|nr:serine/threonine-protein phosphatase [Gammaproteobacteria bacterium]
MKYDIGTVSRQGNRKSNQDRLSIIESGSVVLLIVADGMGGHACGDLAAEATVDCAVRELSNAILPIHNPIDFIKKTILYAHHDVVTLSNIHNPPLKSRTTCVLCMVINGTAYWAHVGDSRLYLLRDGKVVCRTIDHSRVEALYQQGEITESQKLTHPERNLITQCIGSRSYGPQPESSAAVTLQVNDVLLLCSDGLWGALSEKKICDSLREGNLLSRLEMLVDDAERASSPHADNISAAAIRWAPSPGIGANSVESDIDTNNNADLEAMIKNIYTMTIKT